jgi:DNA (cytosine-5)-methyltransferase 1
VNVLSLFAGIGGIELGLERAGMTTIGQVEINPWCRSILTRHWPEVPRHDDVRTAVAWWQSEPRPPVHVVAGGYPCQPFSLAGLQQGTSDERWMWPSMADVIRHVGPQYVVVENVAALVRDPNAFGWMLGDLADLGFDAEWSVLSAPNFGAPHSSRERLYLVAYAPGVDGSSRDLLGAGGVGGSPLAVGGLSGLPASARGGAAREWLASEPRVDRLVDGVPRQVEQLAGYGNAVIPAVAEHVGRMVMAHEGVAA